MSYFKNMKITDEDGNVIEGVDLRNLEEKDLLSFILLELRKMNLQMAIVTDTVIKDTEVE